MYRRAYTEYSTCGDTCSYTVHLIGHLIKACTFLKASHKIVLQLTNVITRTFNAFCAVQHISLFPVKSLRVNAMERVYFSIFIRLNIALNFS